MPRDGDTVRKLVITDVDGQSVPVIDQGSGPAILVVHGGSNGAADWARVADRLAHRFRVLRFDRFTYRRGGRKPDGARMSGAAAMAGEAHDVLAVADAVGEPVVLVGHSSGAVVAMESARASTERFAGMVLYEPPVAVSEPLGGEVLQRALAALDAGAPDRAAAVFYRDIVRIGAPALAALRLIRPLWRRQRELIEPQLVDTAAIDSLGVGLQRYSELDLPARLLGGGLLSPAHARERLRALTSALPSVDSLVIMRMRGHGAHYSAPGAVARAIAEFADRRCR